jgi:hypothetical protein
MVTTGCAGQGQASDASEPKLDVRLPGFVKAERVGLGDVVKSLTSAVGIAPCSGCERRAATLNRWVRFSR